MELKDFISETLTQIIEGVKAAQATEDGQLINARFNARSNLPVGMLNALDNGLVTVVEFDVQVSAETKGTAKGGIKVFSVGAEGGGEIASARANKIKFGVPVRLPDGQERVRHDKKVTRVNVNRR